MRTCVPRGDCPAHGWSLAGSLLQATGAANEVKAARPPYGRRRVVAWAAAICMPYQVSADGQASILQAIGVRCNVDETLAAHVASVGPSFKARRLATGCNRRAFQRVRDAGARWPGVASRPLRPASPHERLLAVDGFERCQRGLELH